MRAVRQTQQIQHAIRNPVVAAQRISDGDQQRPQINPS
jgi:hypothetical protein